MTDPVRRQAQEKSIVLGVDGCPFGWVGIEVEIGTRRTSIRYFKDFASLLSQSSSVNRIGIDIPIGLLEKGARACDQAARRLLGRPRASSVFPAPARPVLSARIYSEACRLSLQAYGKKMSKQSWNILKKVREVDSVITSKHRDRIFEVHPEISFWALNWQQPMIHKKSSSAGKAERLQLLRLHYPDIDGLLAPLDRKKAAPHDLLDAAAAAWTAERISTGSARSVSTPELDSRGLRAEITY